MAQTKQKVIVVGGRVSEAQDYCKANDLGLGSAVILASTLPLRTIKPGFVVRLVGGFHDRSDKDEILREIKNRGGVVEDLTKDMKAC